MKKIRLFTMFFLTALASVPARSQEGWKRYTFQNTYMNLAADRGAIAEGAKATSTEAASTQSSGSQAIHLTSPQAEVWKGEENLHRYEQERDMKRFLSIWDENFVGWPDYERHPVHKAEIESSASEEFKAPGTTNPTLPPPGPEAVGLFGDVAVTHYFWPEADQSSPTVFRITHTWQKGPEGWHIIGGMSCEVPRAAPAQAQPRIATSSEVQAEENTRGMSGAAARVNESKVIRPPAKPDDVSRLDRIINASFDALTGPTGAPRAWDRYLSLFNPDARLVSASVDAAGHTTIHRWSREEYVAAADDYLVKTGFIDRKLGCATNQFGNVATVRCGFEGLEQSKLVERGVAIYQLYNDGNRWWITSLVWDQERAGNPVPAELLTNR